ncbi:ribosome hibernation-promoting factor, HPF/YfiA family [Anaerohalosphaeraceae bacterium U12dextr]
MLFTISGKHIEITDAIRAHAKEKVDKLPRFFDQISHVDVLLDASQGSLPVVEIIARAEHFGDIVAKDSGPDAYTCIDMAVHKLERQLKKIKEKQRDNKFVPQVELPKAE